MVCERCGSDMAAVREMPIQGLRCPNCGFWGVVSTYIDPIYMDMTEYSVYIEAGAEINRDTLKLISHTANVNYIHANQLLMEEHSCILKARAPKVQKVVEKLKELNIDFQVLPEFKY